MTRRTILVVFGAFGLSDLADVVNQSDGDEEAADLNGLSLETTVVTVQNLESDFEATSGNIVFEGSVEVTDPQPGIVGWIVEPESSIRPGDVLYERDDFLVTLLAGDEPAWRTMTVGDVGTDVAQLEKNLLTLGYGTEAEMTVDDTYTSATATVVKRWQADLGVAETGSVNLGDVVFNRGADRVGSVTATVGANTSGSSLLNLTTGDRLIEFTVGADTLGFVAPGTEVEARLPDRSTVSGTVTSVTPAGSGVSVATAAMALDEDQVIPLGDAIPVAVSWTEVIAAEVPTVPAGSIVRLDRGTYAVEVVDDGGAVQLTPIDVGLQVGSRVEIVSGLEVGTTIVST